MHLGKIFAAALVVAWAGGAHAAVTLGDDGDGSSTPQTDQCELSNFTDSLACDGDFTASGGGGNVAPSDLNGMFVDAFGAINGWSQIDKIDDIDKSNRDGENSLFKITTSDLQSGDWELETTFSFDPMRYYSVALSRLLKYARGRNVFPRPQPVWQEG